MHIVVNQMLLVGDREGICLVRNMLQLYLKCFLLENPTWLEWLQKTRPLNNNVIVVIAINCFVASSRYMEKTEASLRGLCMLEIILSYDFIDTHGDGAGNTAEENSSVFSLIRMR